MIDKYQIDALIERSDLMQLAEQAGATLHKTGSEYRSTCPLHGGHNHSGFAIYSSGKKWKCFSGDCGGGDVIEFVKVWRNIGFIQAVEFLGGDMKIAPAEYEQIARQRYENEQAELQRQIAITEKALADFRQAKAWTRYYEQMDDEGKRACWYARGYTDEMIDYFQVGYTPNFGYYYDDILYHSQTITIPIWQADKSIAGVKHRLLSPRDEGDKYRPDVSDLPSQPIHCDYYDGANAKNVLYIEGEIKAEVTYFALNTPGWQVIGLPSKTIFRKDGTLAKNVASTLEFYKGRNSVVLLDPDAKEQAVKLAKYLKGSYILLADKIDDLIIDESLGRDDLLGLIDQARR
jgi:hypothetical protein